MSKAPLYQVVAARILERIQDGTYGPGSRLPTVRQLAEDFDVSRITIRDAEIALAAQGYLDLKPGSGVVVLWPEERAGHELPRISAYELTEARLLFESEAAALAARHINEKALGRLELLLDAMSADFGTHGDTVMESDKEFHLTIARASCNGAVSYIVESLWRMRGEIPEVRDVYEKMCAVDDANDRHAEHAGILAALRSGDSRAAREAMQNHFRRLLEGLIDLNETLALQEVRESVSTRRQRFMTSLAAGDFI